MNASGAETQWYYDIEIRLVVPGSTHVEYVWKLYRDSNNNNIFMDNPTATDGYKACAGDDTPSDPGQGTADAIDLVTPVAPDTFWIGNEWGDGSQFFIGISDFFYQKWPGTGPRSSLADITWPDDDWGYDVPYYFKVTLTYHPGQAQP